MYTVARRRREMTKLPGTKEKGKTPFLTIRCPKSDKELFVKKAKKYGFASLSEFIRYACTKFKPW
jgi:hypothetical protein